MTDATLRPLATRADYEACVGLQRDIWGIDFADVVPATILMVAQEVGGVAAGAFGPDGVLLGFVFGISGVRDGEPVHWSDMLAVRPEARGQGLGKRLKLFQRDLLLAHGVRRMRWTFDPLVARNANLNLNGLGAVPIEYRVNMYGDTHSTLHAGLDTDRLVVDWRLDTPAPEAAPDPGPPPAPVVGADRPGPDDELPAGTRVRVAIPTDIETLKRGEPARAVAWQQAVRRAFTWYLARGYHVTGFTYAATPRESHYLIAAGRGPATARGR